MSVRFYISPIIGSGAEDDGYRPKIADMDVAGWSAPQETDPATGAPLQTYCIVRVEAIDFSALDADPDLTDVTASHAAA